MCNMHIAPFVFRVKKKCVICTFMLIVSLDAIFRPLARLAIAKGIRFAEASERLRRAYVKCAIAEAGSDATDSKLSVLTGLQRRDIARLRRAKMETPPRPDPLSRLVALWLAEFDGAPLARRGPGASFEVLARRIRKDIHPRTSLDALVAAGTVALEGDSVVLKKHAHVPMEGSDELIRYLGMNVGDHLEVAVGNVLGDPPSYELAVHYDGLSEAAVQSLRDVWRERMAPVMQEVNAKALELQNQSPGDGRFRAGGYFRGEI